MADDAPAPAGAPHHASHPPNATCLKQRNTGVSIRNFRFPADRDTQPRRRSPRRPRQPKRTLPPPAADRSGIIRDGLILGDSLSAIPEAAVDPFAGGMVGEDDSPAVLPPKPTAPPPTKVVEAAAAAPPEVVAEAAGAAAATGGVRGLTVEEKAAEASLLQEREELKQAEVATTFRTIYYRFVPRGYKLCTARF
ncbi:hypothetical protein T484DRAFT_1753141 [Baffinella frigidus]|nr:hypothetical protein T484DRAFT_1753141 [Cryptophyta sp. CCMP2293]